MTQLNSIVREDSKRESLKRNIPGWGVDRNPSSRPGVPHERWNPSANPGRWENGEIPLQKSDVPIFLSVERKEMTPVQGTSCPPRGLSGKLRAYAYGIGEARASRWITLLVADRVDVVEGFVKELLSGRLENPFAEKGMGAQLRYNRKLRRTLAVGSGALLVGGLLWWNRKRSRQGRPAEPFREGEGRRVRPFPIWLPGSSLGVDRASG